MIILKIMNRQIKYIKGDIHNVIKTLNDNSIDLDLP